MDDSIYENQIFLSSEDDNGDLSTSKDLPMRSTLYLCCLTILFFGVQLAWSIELSYGTPYLLSLGISKRALSFVWIAGPLSGIIMQPLVGIWSDHTGSRKPYIIVGGMSVIFSLLVIAWTREILGALGLHAAGLVAAVAVIFIYLMDFAINTMQAAARAFITDNVNLSQQNAGNAWASKMSQLAGVFFYSLGYFNLPLRLSFLGDTQLKVLCSIVCFMLGLCLLVSCFAIDECKRPLQLMDKPQSFTQLITTSVHTARMLPNGILRICYSQFACWLAWFPFLFYSTTYIGEIYAQSLYGDNVPSHTEAKELWEEATRIGSIALFLYSIVSFAFSFILPALVIPAFSKEPEIIRFSSWRPSLSTTWTMSNMLLAFGMFATFFVQTPVQAIMLIATMGVCWAVTLWVPFTLISCEISLEGPSSKLRDDAGVILGIHNSFISAPQLLMTLVSSLIFQTDETDHVHRDDSIVWFLRAGGLCALIAAFLTSQVNDKFRKVPPP